MGRGGSEDKRGLKEGKQKIKVRGRMIGAHIITIDNNRKSRSRSIDQIRVDRFSNIANNSRRTRLIDSRKIYKYLSTSLSPST